VNNRVYSVKTEGEDKGKALTKRFRIGFFEKLKSTAAQREKK
jgi:hypothetical protein